MKYREIGICHICGKRQLREDFKHIEKDYLGLGSLICDDCFNKDPKQRKRELRKRLKKSLALLERERKSIASKIDSQVKK